MEWATECGSLKQVDDIRYMVGGRPDHIHVLTSLPPASSLSDFVRNIKANTSKWLKSLHQDYMEFSWQEGYGAFSVSESNKESVIKYIQNAWEQLEVLVCVAGKLVFVG